MKKNHFTIISGFALASLALTSCDTPTGQGAGYGAAAGAIIGGAATGNVRGAAIGAAAGAATGALIGAAIEADQAEAYGPPPPGGFPFGQRAGPPGFYRRPYTGRVYDLRGVPHRGLAHAVAAGTLFRR